MRCSIRDCKFSNASFTALGLAFARLSLPRTLLTVYCDKSTLRALQTSMHMYGNATVRTQMY